MEQRSGIAPLDFRMARYIDAYDIRGVNGLAEALQTKRIPGIGEGTLNRLRAIIGLPLTEKKPTWKSEIKRLYAILDKHKIKY